MCVLFKNEEAFEFNQEVKNVLVNYLIVQSLIYGSMSYIISLFLVGVAPHQCNTHLFLTLSL